MSSILYINWAGLETGHWLEVLYHAGMLRLETEMKQILLLLRNHSAHSSLNC
jgi:hypothetical protein